MWVLRRSKRPSAEQAARRLIILKHVTIHAMATPPRDMLKQLFASWSKSEQDKFQRDDVEIAKDYQARMRALGLWQDVSPEERAFLATTMLTMTEDQQINMLWRVEATQVLMWALGLIPALPAYDTPASHDALKQIPWQEQEVGALIKSARLLPDAEIDRARGLAELWHWRSRTRQLIEEGRALDPDPVMKQAGLKTFDDIVRFTVKQSEKGLFEVIDEDFAAFGKAYRDLSAEEWSTIHSITFERHFALNWLCGYAPGHRWDETPTDT